MSKRILRLIKIWIQNNEIKFYKRGITFDERFLDDRIPVIYIHNDGDPDGACWVGQIQSFRDGNITLARRAKVGRCSESILIQNPDFFDKIENFILSFATRT